LNDFVISGSNDQVFIRKFNLISSMVDKSWKKDHIKIRKIAKDFIEVSKDFRSKVDSGEIDLVDLDIENENSIKNENKNRMEWNKNEKPILLKRRVGVNPLILEIMDHEGVSRATAYKRFNKDQLKPP